MDRHDGQSPVPTSRGLICAGGFSYGPTLVSAALSSAHLLRHLFEFPAQNLAMIARLTNFKIRNVTNSIGPRCDSDVPPRFESLSCGDDVRVKRSPRQRYQQVS